MQKEGWATVVGIGFSIGLTVTPGIQTAWLAVPAWAITAFAGLRWYLHREPSTSPEAFTGKFFPEPRLRRGAKLAWLTVDIAGLAVSFGHGGESCVFVQLEIANTSSNATARLRFFLSDEAITPESRRLTFVPAASKYAVLRRAIPDAPGMPPPNYPPVTVNPGTRTAHLWFFHPSRQSMPFHSLAIEDVESGAMWSVPIDAELARTVKENPRLSVVWPGPHAGPATRPP